MIGGRRPLQGRKPGDRRVRVERPHAPYFRYTGKGMLTAKEAASVPTTPIGRTMASVRGVLFGRPLASEDELGERLSEEEGARDLQLGRHLVVRLRDRGDPAGPDPRRCGRPGVRPRRSASSSRACSSSSPSATGRSASRIRPAAGRTPFHERTSAGPSRWSLPQRCSSTTS